MVRPFAPSDIAVWAAQRSRLWPDADAAELAAEAHQFAAGVQLPGIAAVFIAEDAAATPLGFLELAVRPFSDGCESMPVPHVEGWYVEPGARGRGVGRRLMRAAEHWARANGFDEIASDTELANEASQRAHTGCGFIEVDRLVKFRKPLS